MFILSAAKTNYTVETYEDLFLFHSEFIESTKCLGEVPSQC